MNMTEVNTAALTGVALDWAVAKAEAIAVLIEYSGDDGNGKPVAWLSMDGLTSKYRVEFHPSESWAQCGPLIEKFGLGVVKFYEPIDGPVLDGLEWASLSRDDAVRQDGPTALIAACRAIVAAKLGTTVSVPAELVAV